MIVTWLAIYFWCSLNLLISTIYLLTTYLTKSLLKWLIINDAVAKVLLVLCLSRFLLRRLGSSFTIDLISNKVRQIISFSAIFVLRWLRSLKRFLFCETRSIDRIGVSKSLTCQLLLLSIYKLSCIRLSLLWHSWVHCL